MEPFRCPRCRSELRSDGGVVSCSATSCRFYAEGFRTIGGLPVLIDDERSIVDPRAVEFAHATRSPIALRLFGRTRNRVAERAISAILGALDRAGSRRRIVVVGGGSIGSGVEALYAQDRHDVIGFDVYGSPHVHVIADGHQIPLADRSADAVIVQAVLEHVLDPWQVVAEIHRVLRRGGLVYADTPFLQHVHEGPYDFTRFTESGHRWLFRSFERIDSGVVAGVSTQFAWSLAHLLRSIVPVRGVATVVRTLTERALRSIDGRIPHGNAIDGASAVYFLGRRAETSISPHDIVGHYRGAGRTPERS